MPSPPPPPRRFAAAAQDLLQHPGAQQVAREGHQVEGEERACAHGVDVRERVGRGDATEVERIVHDGREEVHRGHERTVGIEAVDGRVVRLAAVHEDGRVVEGDQVTQDLRQLGGAELAGSAGAVRKLAEADAIPLIVVVAHGR